MPFKDPEKARAYHRERWRSKKLIDYQRARMQARVREALRLKGNACRACGVSGVSTPLHFHHVDPVTKEFEVTAGWSRRRDLWLLELEKTILLCEECHAMVHFGSAAPKELKGRLEALRRRSAREAERVAVKIARRQERIEEFKEITRRTGVGPYQRQLRAIESARHADWIGDQERAARAEAAELVGLIFPGERSAFSHASRGEQLTRDRVMEELAVRLREDRLAAGPSEEERVEWREKGREVLRARRRKLTARPRTP
jgi:hypothetical protein